MAACASAAMVMENTTPATVIIEPAMVASTSRAPSASSVNSHGRRSAGAVPSARSSATSASASAIAAETIIAGRNQKLERRLIASRLTVPLEMRLPIPPPVRRPKVAMSWSRPCEAAPTRAACCSRRRVHGVRRVHQPDAPFLLKHPGRATARSARSRVVRRRGAARPAGSPRWCGRTTHMHRTAPAATRRRNGCTARSPAGRPRR